MVFQFFFEATAGIAFALALAILPSLWVYQKIGSSSRRTR